MTPGKEKYLRAIYDLTAETEDTRVCAIATHLGVSKASASVAVGWLNQNGIVIKRGMGLRF